MKKTPAEYRKELEAHMGNNEAMHGIEDNMMWDCLRYVWATNETWHHNELEKVIAILNWLDELERLGQYGRWYE